MWAYSRVEFSGQAAPKALVVAAAGEVSRLHKLVVTLDADADIELMAGGSAVKQIGTMFLKAGVPLVIPWSGHDEDCIIGDGAKGIAITTTASVVFNGYAIVSADNAEMEV